MDWTPLSLNTLVPQIPKIVNDNFTAFQLYLDLFYDEVGDILVKPLHTTGRVKGATGEFVNVVVDNLTVKNQWTNRYENSTTADYDYYVMYTTPAFVPRDPCTYGIDTSVWNVPYEPAGFKVIDVNKPYYKITNENPINLSNDNLSQVVGIFFGDASGTDDFEILLDPCTFLNYTVDASSSGIAYMEFISTSYDPSWGSTWTQFKYGADDSSSGGSGTVGPGTIGTIPVFDTINNIGDSSIYMSGSTLVTRDIQIHNAVRDSSGGILIGYGSPVQINNPESGRDVSIYGDTRIDGSLYVNGEEVGLSKYDPTLSDALEMPVDVGGILAGTTVADLRGKTYDQLFNDLLFPTVMAYIQTTNNATLSGISTATLEVGLPMTPSTTGIYNPGDINNGDETNGPDLTGSGNYYTFKLPNGTIDGTYATAGDSQAHVFSSYNLIFGSNIWDVSISYDAGTGAYYDNKSNAGTNLDALRVAGIKTDNSSTVTARRYAWRGTGLPVPINSTQVRALSSKSFLGGSDTGTFDITIAPSTPNVYFFIPIGKTVLVNYVQSSMADVTSSFTAVPISVNDAGAAAQSYESWTATIGGGGYPGTATYRVTIS